MRPWKPPSQLEPPVLKCSWRWLLGSLFAERPLMFYLALESIGRETAKGRDFAARWQYAGFRRTFRVMTLVWGVTYLAVAASHIVIIETESVGTALSVSKVLPYIVLGILITWTIGYGKRAQRRGEAPARQAANAAAAELPSA